MYEQPIIQEKRFEYNGLPCVILRMVGFWSEYRCGYVGLPEGNRYFGKIGDRIPVFCHGGITYSDSELYFQTDSNVWWIGFDCNHGFDLGITRSLEYCENECKSIIDQIMEKEGKDYGR